MSASCSQYVITILPGFLALTANLKLQRLSFVRIQLVVKEVAQKKLLHYEQLCQVKEITIESKPRKLVHESRLNLHLFQLSSCIEFVTSSGR